MTKHIIKTFEYFLSLIVLLATGFYALFVFGDIPSLMQSDSESFYKFLSSFLLVVVGLELARLMISHSFEAVIEIMILIVARKMLSPSITSLDILYTILAFTLLVGVYGFIKKNPLEGLERLG